MLTIAGAGMAGLVAAARARELGVPFRLVEKGDRAGGSMLLSSCVIWRYRTLELFREQCPDGDAGLQALVVERLDQGLSWLEGLGARVLARETGNPLTAGWRFDPVALTAVLVRAAGEVELQTAVPDDAEPLLLATGGFQGNPALVEEHVAPAAPLPVRANPWSAGDGLGLALERGAALSPGLDEFYGRNMPDSDWTERDFVSAAQLYAAYARVVNEQGNEFLDDPVSWSETDVVQATARQPRAAAWYLLDEAGLSKRVRGRPVVELVERAAALGGTVLPAGDLPFDAPRGTVLGVRVRAAITHTIGGVRVDERARVLGSDGAAIAGLYAAGVDAGGISTGGYASGLAAALVLARVAAETAAAEL